MHFETIGGDPIQLNTYYAEQFEWTFQENSPVAPEVSETDNYPLINRMTTADGTGIPGGVGLGGERVLGPARNEAGRVLVGHFPDPPGDLVGVPGPK